MVIGIYVLLTSSEYNSLAYGWWFWMQGVEEILERNKETYDFQQAINLTTKNFITT